MAGPRICPQPLSWSGVKGTGKAIQEVANQVSHLQRSWSSNLITAGHVSLTSLPVNGLRHNLRVWISPPDPNVNLRTASGAHHEGTAAWCIEGSTLATWKESGSLLWIHGKRTYPIIFLVVGATNDRMHSWFWEEYSQVRYSLAVLTTYLQLM